MLRGADRSGDVVPAINGYVFEEYRPPFKPVKARDIIGVDGRYGMNIPGPPPIKKSFDDYMQNPEFLKILPKGFWEQLMANLFQDCHKQLARPLKEKEIVVLLT